MTKSQNFKKTIEESDNNGRINYFIGDDIMF